MAPREYASVPATPPNTITTTTTLDIGATNTSTSTSLDIGATDSATLYSGASTQWNQIRNIISRSPRVIKTGPRRISTMRGSG